MYKCKTIIRTLELCFLDICNACIPLNNFRFWTFQIYSNSFSAPKKSYYHGSYTSTYYVICARCWLFRLLACHKLYHLLPYGSIKRVFEKYVWERFNQFPLVSLPNFSYAAIRWMNVHELPRWSYYIRVLWFSILADDE